MWKQYPSAPDDPKKLKEWLLWRNNCIKRYSGGVKIIGAGVPPKESK